MVHTSVRRLVALAVVLVVLLPGGSAGAHGVEITYTLTPVMAMRVDLAALDVAGDPLAKAVVDIYAPGQDETWFSTELGKTGALTVIPDVRLPGVWTFVIHKDDGSAALHLPLAFGTGYARVAASEIVSVEAHVIGLSYALTEIPTVVIALDAAFESGDVMAGAQVSVYAPDNAKTPWLIGVCNDAGHFEFVADSANTGVWDIQVRQAGHGEWINIELTPDAVQVSAADASESGSRLSLSDRVSSSVESSGGYTTGQIVLMSASIIWGMVGTALYVARRRETSPPQQESN